jgi:hypothetical protein
LAAGFGLMFGIGLADHTRFNASLKGIGGFAFSSSLFLRGVFDMAPPKKAVLRALSDSHLRAIGMVAAQWSSLEVTLLWIVSRAFKIRMSQAVILAGAQNAPAWCEMLRKEMNPPIERGKKTPTTKLDKLAEEVAKLLKLRNDVVHTAWDPHGEYGLIDGEAGEVLNARLPRIKAAHKASGTGIPKRGSKLIIETELTAAEMIAIATRIEAVEQALFVWWRQRNQTNRLADLLRTPSDRSIPAKSPAPRAARN